MGTFKESASAVKNALSFLGPLSAMAGVLEEAEKAETFLATAKPEVDRLKGECQKWADTLGEIRTAVRKEEEFLSRLQAMGEQDVKDRVASVERSLGESLRAASEQHDVKMRSMGVERGELERVIDELKTVRDDLRSDVSNLVTKIAVLNRDMENIAKRAKGDK